MVGWVAEEERELIASDDLSLAAFLYTARQAGLPRQSRRALELGCGPAGRAALLAPHFAEYVGVDPDADAVERARSGHERLANARFSVGSALDDEDFARERYDLVVCDVGRLPRKRDELAAVRRLLQLLAPGGLLLVTVPRRRFRAVNAARWWTGGRVMWIDKRRASSTVYCVVRDAVRPFEPVLIRGGL
jgi:SAM-dependent methyltransferase